MVKSTIITEVVIKNGQMKICTLSTKPSSKDYIWHDYIYVMFLKWQKWINVKEVHVS